MWRQQCRCRARLQVCCLRSLLLTGRLGEAHAGTHDRQVFRSLQEQQEWCCGKARMSLDLVELPVARQCSLAGGPSLLLRSRGCNAREFVGVLCRTELPSCVCLRMSCAQVRGCCVRLRASRGFVAAPVRVGLFP